MDQSENRHTSDTVWTKQAVFRIYMHVHICICMQSKWLREESNGFGAIEQGYMWMFEGRKGKTKMLWLSFISKHKSKIEQNISK